MSADNYIAIQKRDSKYYVWMDFASNDNPKPDEKANIFDNYDNALWYAQGWCRGESIVEYGIQTLGEYVTPIKTTGRDIYRKQNELISNAADQIRKGMEGCSIFGILVDMNNVNHLIVAAYHSALLVTPKSGISMLDHGKDYDLEARLALAIGK